MLFYFMVIMRKELRVSLFQLPLAWEDPEENIRVFSEWVEGSGPTDLFLLPEMWATGFSMSPEKIALEESSPVHQWMSDTAKKTNAVVAGSLATKSGNFYYNRFYACHPSGSRETYDKRHLFAYAGEDKKYSAGDKRLLLEIKGWHIMVIVCYDLRFPVWCRNTMDYDLLVVVANWPEARISHWDALLRARAIENQCYVAAVNRIGVDGTGLVYPGHSAIYDMNGEPVVYGGGTEGVIQATLFADKLDSFRNRYPFLADRDTD